MFFKNARLFRLTKPLDFNADQLEEQLQEHVFQPCNDYQSVSLGWTIPVGKQGKLLVHQTDGRLMLCACKEERLLPASVLKDAVEQDVARIEAQQDRRVFPSEKRRLREEALQRLLPKAFTKKRYIFGYLDPLNQWLVIESATTKMAEEFCTLLRQSLGSLPVVPMICQQEPASVMSHWLQKSSLPANVETGEDCVLRDQSDSRVVLRTRGIDLDSPDFTHYIDTGMRVVKLSLSWQKQVDFVLSDDFSLSRIRFNDLLREDSGNLEPDDLLGQFDADFAILGRTFNQLLNDLIAAMGGIDESIQS